MMRGNKGTCECPPLLCALSPLPAFSQFIMIDTTMVSGIYGNEVNKQDAGAVAQRAWVESELANSKVRARAPA